MSLGIIKNNDDYLIEREERNMGLNKEQIDIIPIPKKCRYCGNNVVLTSNAEIYGKEYGNGKCYLCRNCKAFVGVHTGTEIPLGTLANNELREERKKAHYKFDKLWKKPTRIMTRCNAYKWLAKEMGIDIKNTHIALFEIEQCKKVIELVDKKIGGKKYGFR